MWFDRNSVKGYVMKSFSFRVFIGFVSLVVLPVVLLAELKMPNIFSDNMVLQRGIAVPVWGWTEAGALVTVLFNGQKKLGKADADGKWTVKLDPMKESAQALIMTVVSPGGDKTIKNILIGDVWLCSGQSNMEWVLPNTDNGAEVIKAADYPLIRLINVPNTATGVLLSDNNCSWSVCTPQTVGGFSAVGYYFGKALYEKLNVPIGLFGSNWGGTRIEPWTPRCGFENIAGLEGILSGIDNADKTYRQQIEKQLDPISAWVNKATAAKSAGREIPSITFDFPAHPYAGRNGEPTALYNGMLAPFVPYAIRGAIWYQGESNLGDGIFYAEKMQALLAGWRKVWDQGIFPFYFCQIAPFVYGNSDDECVPRLWEGQYKALKLIPESGMASTVDLVDDLNNIHPRNKKDVGHRLALLALSDTYKISGLEAHSPEFRSMTESKGKLVVSFNNVGKGLKTSDGGPVKEFRIAGADGEFVDALAEISDGQIIVSSDKVQKPVSVKYAWRKICKPNLQNMAGLPVLPFSNVYDPFEGKTNFALNRKYTSSDVNSWGWGGGLTDGNWGEQAGTCFATANAPVFPKHVVIDLENECSIKTIILGVPAFGSTKTLEVLLGTDNKNFQKMGSHAFELRKTQKKTFTFDTPVKARYIKINAPDHHDENVNYDPSFVFITEVMAYGE